MGQFIHNEVSVGLLLQGTLTLKEKEAKTILAGLQKGIENLVKKNIVSSDAARYFRKKRAQALFNNEDIIMKRKSNNGIISEEQALQIIKDNGVIESKKWSQLVHILLAAVPSGKYVSRKYLVDALADFPNEFGARRFEYIFLSTLGSMFKRGIIDRVKVNETPYKRMKLENVRHYNFKERYVSKLEKMDLLTERIKTLIVDYKPVKAIEEVLKIVNDKQRLELGFVTEEEADKNLLDFAENQVHGPIKIIGPGQTQSVFKLSKKGLSKLDILLTQVC